MDATFATLVYAQLDRGEDMQRWRSRLLAERPDFSGELFSGRWGTGTFLLPQAAAERSLWLDSLEKANLPECATPEQLAGLKIKPLPECEAERARLAGAQ